MDAQDILDAVGNVAGSIKNGMESAARSMGAESKEALEGIKGKVQELARDMESRDKGLK